MAKLQVLDLFSGIGGFSLGLERATMEGAEYDGFETVAFCEIEEFPRKVLAKHWPDVPCYRDVRELTAEQVGAADVVCGGYPCQPFSTAGKRLGEEDDRHLWPEFMRLVAELRPTWVIGENVAGHISMGLDAVLSDLENEGYSCRPFVVPACAVDAPHRRDRVWTVAHSGEGLYPSGLANRENPRTASGGEGQDQCRNGSEDGQWLWAKSSASGSDAPHTERLGQSQPWWAEGRVYPETHQDWEASLPFNDCRWGPEPELARVGHGIPNGMERIAALGNAVVPQIPELIGRAILAAQNTTIRGDKRDARKSSDWLEGYDAVAGDR